MKRKKITAKQKPHRLPQRRILFWKVDIFFFLHFFIIAVCWMQGIFAYINFLWNYIFHSLTETFIMLSSFFHLPVNVFPIRMPLSHVCLSVPTQLLSISLSVSLLPQTDMSTCPENNPRRKNKKRLMACNKQPLHEARKSINSINNYNFRRKQS